MSHPTLLFCNKLMNNQQLTEVLFGIEKRDIINKVSNKISLTLRGKVRITISLRFEFFFHQSLVFVPLLN